MPTFSHKQIRPTVVQVLTRREERPSCLLDKYWIKNRLRKRETDGSVEELRCGEDLRRRLGPWRQRPARRRREADGGVEEVRRGIDTAAWRSRPAQRRWRRKADGGGGVVARGGEERCRRNNGGSSFYYYLNWGM